MSYLREGDIVRLNKELPNKPDMMVYKIKKEKTEARETPFNQLIGIECMWFSTTLEIQFGIFNFKDLEVIESDYDG